MQCNHIMYRDYLQHNPEHDNFVSHTLDLPGHRHPAQDLQWPRIYLGRNMKEKECYVQSTWITTLNMVTLPLTL